MSNVVLIVEGSCEGGLLWRSLAREKFIRKRPVICMLRMGLEDRTMALGGESHEAIQGEASATLGTALA